MSKRIRFTVTQEHIDRGAGPDKPLMQPESCPIALALRESAPDHDWNVWGPMRGARHGLVTDGNYDDARERWTLSERACAFIRAFDANKPVQPFTGEISQ